jgi:hypothetical protein
VSGRGLLRFALNFRYLLRYVTFLQRLSNALRVVTYRPSVPVGQVEMHENVRLRVGSFIKGS